MDILYFVVVPVPMESSLHLILYLAVIFSRQVGGISIITVIIVVRFRFRSVIFVISTLPINLMSESPIGLTPLLILILDLTPPPPPYQL